MTARLAAVATAHAHILARRRTAVALLALLPLAIYGALYRHSPHAVTVGGVASAFSAGGAAIFSMLPARAADQRLALAGYRPAVLITGRLIVLEAASIVISLITASVMIAGTGPAHPADAFAGVILTGVAAVPLGLALGALLPRELEAVLVLIGIVGIQITADPDTLISALLPFHAASQLLDAAAGAPATFWPRLALTVAYSAALLAIAWAAWRHRAGIRRSPNTTTHARRNHPARARTEGGSRHGS
jgi:hypothetical protein